MLTAARASMLSLTLLFTLLSIESKAKPDPEFVKSGQAIYGRTCAACHSPTGEGTPQLFPPLIGSEWLTKDSSSLLIRIVIYGVEGPMRFEGKKFNNRCMPPYLSDEEVAQVVTFAAATFNGGSEPVSGLQVKAVRDANKERKGPWTAYELDPSLALEGSLKKVKDDSITEKIEQNPVLAGQLKRGRAVYMRSSCFGCHNINGEGLPSLYPPLAGSEWVAMGPKVIIPIILNGLEGPVVVNKQLYDATCWPRAEWSAAAIVAGRLRRLADRTSSKRPLDLTTQQEDIDDINRIEGEIADLVAYVGNSWGNKIGPVSVDEVKAIRASISSRDKPWTADELKAKK